jgi:hypothetical protein
MTGLLIFAVVAIMFAAVTWLFIVSAKRNVTTDDQRRVELLKEARAMYPTAENDIDALDQLYQHKYRLMLALKKAGNVRWQDALRDTVHIWNERNETIKRSVDFEQKILFINSEERNKHAIA